MVSAVTAEPQSASTASADKGLPGAVAGVAEGGGALGDAFNRPHSWRGIKEFSGTVARTRVVCPKNG